MIMNCVQVAALASVNTFNPNPLPITIISLTRLYPQRGEDWGSWYCSIGQLFLQTISVILILKCSIAVFSEPAGCDVLAFLTLLKISSS